MKKFCLVIGCLLMLGSTPGWAQDPTVVIVRVVERPSSVLLLIARGTAIPEVVEFESGSVEKRAVPAAVGYQRVIATLYEQGYALQSTISGSGVGGVDNNVTYSTLIFVKASK